MAGWHRSRRRAGVWLARLRRRAAEAWDGRRGVQLVTAVALALAVNAGLIAMFGRLPLRLPPDGGGGAPIEIVFLPAPPEPVPVPEVDLAPVEAVPAEEALPEPAPAPRRGPAAPDAELPSARGASGVVALDCRKVFDEKGRAIACAGGDITLGYEVDREAWDAIAAEVPRYGPRAPERPSGFGEADDRFAVESRRLDGFRRQGTARLATGDAKNAPPASVIAASGADGAAASGSDILTPPSFITSYGDRRVAADRQEARDDAVFRRERLRDLEAE